MKITQKASVYDMIALLNVLKENDDETDRLVLADMLEDYGKEAVVNWLRRPEPLKERYYQLYPRCGLYNTETRSPYLRKLGTADELPQCLYSLLSNYYASFGNFLKEYKRKEECIGDLFAALEDFIHELS